ncbi:ABC transporter permease [Achromobacter veterisilvae]|jgi:peptide/nickel transport system permease protein|uniref:ABC transporter permease n=1 Tax=Achromobacter veterisilvae TaxID=2069367 RepID=A0A446C396_9BURK|nr:MULTISPECIES: ABC transporter permease [Achromobacter]MCW0209878.1 ABC transporter permease [Achromobacter sp.]SSW62354.1 Nickel transport system permease protein NikC [Achromobacter veterisilvae]
MTSIASTLPAPGRGERAARLGRRFGLAMLVLLVLAGLIGPYLIPHDPYTQDLLARLQEPVWGEDGNWNHILGTDQLGRDVLARALYGVRVSALIGLSVALMGGLIGTTLGVVAGYFGGPVDRAVSFLITARLALPIILVALAVVSVVGASLTVVVLVLGLLLWERYALVARTMAAGLRNAEFVTASRLQGCTHLQIIWSDILPNLVGNLLIIGTVDAAMAITLEASLSFLGLGVPAPMPSLGLMIAEGKENMLFQPSLVVIPSVVLFVLVLCVNRAGESLRAVQMKKG